MLKMFKRSPVRTVAESSETERWFQVLLDAAPDAMVVVDQDGKIVLVNAQTENLFGYQREEIVGLDVERLIPERLCEQHRLHRKGFFAQPHVRPMGAGLELFGVRKGGDEFPVEVSLSPVKTREGVLVTSAIRDVSERKRAEEARLWLAAMVESSQDAIISKNRDAVITSWNASAERLFGYAESEAVGKSIRILIPPQLQDEENKVLEKLSAGGCIEHYETVRITKAGNRIDVSLSLSPIKDSSGRIVGFCKIVRDITERKRAEQDLLSSEQRYRLLFQRNVGGVAIASLDGRMLDCNDGWAHILGYESTDELRGRHASEFYFNPAERKPLVDELSEKQVLLSRELQLRRRDGTPVWVLFNAAVHSDRETPIVQCTMIDISERKKAEDLLSGMTRTLIQAQEQERARIGRELHDDINQRLAMLAVKLGELGDDPWMLRNRVQQLRSEVAEISNDVQALSHELHSSKLEYLGVVAGIRSWCKEFAEHQKMEVDFSSDVAHPLPFEIGLCLFRVLQEALHNAVKHSGVKHVAVRLVESSHALLLTIRDLGVGFDLEESKQGRGLGLTSMQERVRLVNGTITIESRLGGGTTIQVHVPFNLEDASRQAAS